MRNQQLEALRASFAGRLYSSQEEMAPFLTDWRGKWTGSALAVAQPDAGSDVAAIMKWCHSHRVPVVPQGGNTGLSGGSTPDSSGNALVLCLTRLRQIRRVDPVNNAIEVEAGVTLQAVQEAALEAGRLFPLSLAAQGTCTLGGNLATNAGGVQVLRYGTARELCLGLEVVTPDGQIWNGLRALRKDNTGYDLRDLYIGSEGTLGVITAAVMKLHPLPAAKVVSLVAVPTPSAAVALLALCQARAGSSLTAFEFMNERSLELVEAHVPGARRPLSERSPWYVLLEVSDARDEVSARSVIEDALGTALESELATDAVIAENLSQSQSLWALREDISESQAAAGKTIKHDISLPIAKIADFIASTNDALGKSFPKMRLVVFGHLGDGNLHYNLSPDKSAGAYETAEFVASEPMVNQLVHDAVAAHGGSISAEHGLGVLRRDESARYKSPVELSLMAAIKHALDPYGLMNPGKVLPSFRHNGPMQILEKN